MKHLFYNTKLVLLVFTSLMMGNISAQNAKKEVNFVNQQWLQYYNKLEISKKSTLLHDISFRWKNSCKDQSLFLIRTGYSYKFKGAHSIAAGVACTGAYMANQISRLELRPWQEIVFQNKLRRINLSNRFRLEERIFNDIKNRELVGSESFNFRARYRLQFVIPLNHSAPSPGTIYLNCGDEVFINFGDKIVYNSFDSNRLLAGVGYQVGRHLVFNINYVRQVVHTSKKDSYIIGDLIWISLTHTITAFNESK